MQCFLDCITACEVKIDDQIPTNATGYRTYIQSFCNNQQIPHFKYDRDKKQLLIVIENICKIAYQNSILDGNWLKDCICMLNAMAQVRNQKAVNVFAGYASSFFVNALSKIFIKCHNCNSVEIKGMAEQIIKTCSTLLQVEHRSLKCCLESNRYPNSY